MSSPSKPARRKRRSPGNEQLNRDAWLDAASAAIEEGGFDNVRILILAEKLGVSRGSFYWHFLDHAEFIKSYLDKWKASRLRELLYWRPTMDDPERELYRIIHLLLSESARNLRRLRIELAVRDYARRDEWAAHVIAEVDQARVSQVLPLLERITKERSEAIDLALALFAMVIGAQLLLTGPTIEDAAMVQAVDRLVDLTISGKD